MCALLCFCIINVGHGERKLVYRQGWVCYPVEVNIDRVLRLSLEESIERTVSGLTGDVSIMSYAVDVTQ